MKKLVLFLIVSGFVFLMFSPNLLAEKPLSQLYLYKGEVAGTGPVAAGPEGKWTGPGFSMIKLKVGESAVITVKGLDEDSNEVAIWPTFKADRELQLVSVLGKGRTVEVKAVKAATLAYVTATVVTSEGKKVTVDGMFEVKEAK